MYVDRRKKVESGQRATSLYYMINKPGLIRRILNKAQPESRALYFMLGQFGKHNNHPAAASWLTIFKFTLFSPLFLLSLFSITHLAGRAHTSCSYSA